MKYGIETSLETFRARLDGLKSALHFFNLDGCSFGVPSRTSDINYRQRMVDKKQKRPKWRMPTANLGLELCPRSAESREIDRKTRETSNR